MIRAILFALAAALGSLIVLAALIYWFAGPLPPEGGGVLAALGWFGHILLGDFGLSVSRSAPAGALLAQSLAVTLPLFLLASLIAVLVAGLVTLLALNPGHSARVRLIADIGTGLSLPPPLFIGLFLMLLLAVWLGWFPAGGFFTWGQSVPGALWSLILPMLAVGLPAAGALLVLYARALAAFWADPAIIAARLAGQSAEQIMRQRGPRALLLRLLPDLRLLLPLIFSSTFIVEPAFYLPGLGRLLVDAILAADPALTRATLFVATLLCLLLVLLVDIARAAADPRLQRGEVHV